MFYNWWQLFVICIIVLLIIGVFLYSNYKFTQVVAYSLIRKGLTQYTLWYTRHWHEIESEHFLLRYQQKDKDIAHIVIDTAENAFNPTCNILKYKPRNKNLIIIYPDRESLARQFGWAANESAMGVYWAGVIRILSPHDWVASEDLNEICSVFRKSGPVAHEFAHLLVDEKAKGNYPRWLTEGIAQYVEYLITGFSMPGSTDAKSWYPLTDMDYNFDSLPDQSLAYRQSCLMVEYFVKKWGQDALCQVLDFMGKGLSINDAFKEVIGISLEEFEAQFKNDVSISRSRFRLVA
ncbi:MAG: hypothetical protein PWP31_1135 [Clostridia bacterium]|nr:hypothetical protein [Clostridia bacterium]